MANLAFVFGRVLLGLALLITLVVVVSALIAATAQAETRGRLVEVAQGRELRLVCEGPQSAAGPTVWMEAGAYGFAAEWAEVQPRLARLGIRSCAYDRAGLGFSDPGPAPRDANAIAADLEALIVASGERGPFVFLGHSAAGLYIRTYAGLHPNRVAGLVLVDAMTPESVSQPPMNRFFGRFKRLSAWGAIAASMGLTKPLALFGVGDSIGLDGAAHREKLSRFGSGRHHRAAAAEIRDWDQAIEQAAALPPYRPEWPLAIVMADRPGMTAFNNARAAPARASVRGRVEVVKGAQHATLLGPQFADRIVDAVQFVAADPAHSSS